jgi:hypothetical protein
VWLTISARPSEVSITVTSSPLTGSGFINVDGEPITTPATFTWTAGSSHTLTALSPVSAGTDKQYVWTSWSDDGTQIHNYTVPNTNQTITANFTLQYLITFNQTGLDGTATGTVVTIDSSAKTYGNLPFSEWVDNGTSVSYSYREIVSSNITGKLFMLNSVNGPSSPIAVTGPVTVIGNYVIKVHDVAVTSIVPERTIIFRGDTTKINVTILDNGNFSETVNVTLYYNLTTNKIVGTQTVTLSPAESETLSFIWNTSGVAYSPKYTLTAVATIPTGDFTPADNTFSIGHVKVTILGDVNGDGTVNILDVVMASRIYMSRRGSPNYNPVCDPRGDGVIDIMDIVSIIRYYGITVYNSTNT